MAKNASIFNDVLGPLMTGPSSSHTAAPWRIAYTTACFLEDIVSLQVFFPKNSSYAEVYQGQGTDIAIIAGILQLPINSPYFKEAKNIAKERGLSFSFSIIDEEHEHPNTAIFKISSKEQSKEIMSLSTGGGAFCLIAIDGQRVDISGEANFLYGTEKEGLQEIVNSLEEGKIQSQIASDNADFFLLKVSSAPSEELLHKIHTKNASVLCIPALLPVAAYEERLVPFKTAQECLDYCEKHALSFAEAALLYEMEYSSWPREQVYEFADFLFKAIENSIQTALSSELKSLGFLRPSAKKMYDNFMANQAKTIDSGLVQKACIYSTAIMEANSAMGLIVAGPTAGSCGLIGGVLVALYESGKYTRQEILEAFLCAGLVGIFIAHQATFAAEECACQAEIGAASSMAAGAIAHLLGASPSECCKAASMALQNMLGLVCDPVANCVEIPCVNRNASGLANAIVSANMLMCGFDPYIPLDETIQAMYAIGKMLPQELRCTGLGGLSVTPTAQKIKKEVEGK